jgi:hypothetical protein
MNARLRAISCHCPPDSCTPPVEPLAQGSVEAVGKAVEQRAGAAVLRRPLHPRPVLDPGYVTETDVLGRRRLVRDEILEDRPDHTAQLVGVEVGDVHAIEQDAALCRVVHPAQQLRQRGFSRAVSPDDGDRLPGQHFEAHVPQGGRRRVRIGERDMIEHHVAAHRPGQGQRRHPPAQLRLSRQQLVQLVQVQVVLVHAGKPLEH